MNGIEILKEDGGLSRQLPVGDHISGLIVYGENKVDKTVLYSAFEMQSLEITIENNPVLFYHISEFFRINDGATLYVQSVDSSDGNYTEVLELQSFARGSIRQLAVCDFKTDFTSSSVGTLNEKAKSLSQDNTPLSILLSMKITSVAMTQLIDLHTLNSDKVSVVIGQDVGGLGGFLSEDNPSISCIGTILGAVSKANVHESIGWVEKQNLVSSAYGKDLTDGTDVLVELDDVGFCDGSKSKNYTQGQLQSIFDKGYIFGIYYTGVSGTYICDSFTSTTLTSDYAYIENNRTVDKAIRLVNTTLLPKVSSPAYINVETGELEETTTTTLEVLCEDQLDQMVRAGEISGYLVSIDATQQVLQTSKLQVVLKIVPVGTLRTIEVKIGLTLKTT